MVIGFMAGPDNPPVVLPLPETDFRIVCIYTQGRIGVCNHQSIGAGLFGCLSRKSNPTNNW